MPLIARAAALLLAASLLASAQRVSVGISAGVPISSDSRDDGPGCLATRTAPDSAVGTICGPNRLFAHPYSIGPEIGLRLAGSLSIEAAMLYQRFHQDVSQGLVVTRGGASFGQYYGVSANAWLFPLQLKYVFGQRALSPFVAAGATLRHLGPFNGSGIQLDPYLVPQPASLHIETGTGLAVAETVGAGMRWRAAGFDISPGIRFLHWTSVRDQPVRNQWMLMLGFAFPASR